MMFILGFITIIVITFVICVAIGTVVGIGIGIGMDNGSDIGAVISKAYSNIVGNVKGTGNGIAIGTVVGAIIGIFISGFIGILGTVVNTGTGTSALLGFSGVCVVAFIGNVIGYTVAIRRGTVFVRKVYCPFCFESIKLTEIKFFCKHCNVAIHHEPSFLERCGIIRLSSMRCSCGHVSAFKVCPHPDCGLELPNQIADLPDISIAIIGAAGVGKTHYIALLIQRIKELTDVFDWSLTPIDNETVTRYTREFYEPLFNHHTTIPATQAGERIRPLLYSLRLKTRLPHLFSRLNDSLPGFLRLKKQKKIMLAFFDTAGENINKELHEMDTIGRYVCNAAGIICLLDPLQMSLVREELQRKIELPPQTTDTAQVLNQMFRLIQYGFNVQGRKMTRNDQVPIPLAVTFSKIDAISAPDENCPPTLLHESNALYQESRHTGHLNLGDFINISDHMRDWLDVVDKSHEIKQTCNHFEKCVFFGVSALGENPTVSGTKEVLSRDPRPRRVEDPFLWILSQCKLVDVVSD